jgi:hypothetical protein
MLGQRCPQQHPLLRYAPVKQQMTIIRKEESACGTPKKKPATTGRISDMLPAVIWYATACGQKGSVADDGFRHARVRWGQARRRAQVS